MRRMEQRGVSSHMMEPSLKRFYDSEEERLRGILSAVRSAISHAGEKGRVLENEVTALIRKMLPSEYGVSTGFIAYCSNGTVRLSSQIDIIIYDALRGAPLVSFDTCGVFPIEIVYAYIEIKATLDSRKLSDSIRANTNMRSLRERTFWITHTGSPPATDSMSFEWMPVRAFVFAFESKFGTAGTLGQAVRDKLTASSGAHIHGVFVADAGFLSPHRIAGEMENNVSEIFFTTTRALIAFKMLLIKSLATFDKPYNHWSPAIDRYHYDLLELSQSA